MKLLKVVLAILLAFSLLWILVAVFSPDTISVEEKISIEQSQIEVFSQVNDLSRWTYWAVWFTKDPGMDISLSAKNNGAGAKMTWNSESEGSGSQEIVESHSPNWLRMKLTMDDWNENHYNLSLEKLAEFETMVTWTFEEVELPFILRPLGFSFSNSIKEDFKQSLNDLKVYCENLPRQNKKLSPSKIETSDIYYISKVLKSNSDEFASDLGQAYGELIVECRRNNWEIIGMPFTIYSSIGDETSEYEAAFQLSEKVVARGNYSSGTLPGGTCVTVSHFGLYENLGVSYLLLDKYLEQNDLALRDRFYEIYVTDPGAEPDSSKWETQIFYPVRNK